MPPRDRPDLPELPGLLTAEQVLATARSIAAAQEPSGAIPWEPGGHTDPWDHVECAMALSAAGLSTEAVRAYDWLRHSQRPDGSWPARVRAGVVEHHHGETNHAAYVAVGTWHHLLVTGDERFAARMWDVVRRAVDFVVGKQADRGEIAWAHGADGRTDGTALLTGCASVHQSLRCALALADWLDAPQPEWELAAGRLGHVVAEHPEAFEPKGRFSMDWYYPVLGGAVRGEPAVERLAARWDEFVIPGVGIRCVDDEPWVTGAETCELALALDALGDRDRALGLLADVQHLRAGDGSYWTGWQLDLAIMWPEERSTWTAAAVILAADALARATPGNGIFRGDGLPTGLDLDERACGCLPDWLVSAEG
ncbi:MAG: prenyltransferase [Actinomycetes bacterium]